LQRILATGGSGEGVITRPRDGKKNTTEIKILLQEQGGKRAGRRGNRY